MTSVINTDDKILKEAKSFDQKLYSSCKPQSILDYEDIFFLKVPLGHLRSRREKNAKVY